MLLLLGDLDIRLLVRVLSGCCMGQRTRDRLLHRQPQAARAYGGKLAK